MASDFGDVGALAWHVGEAVMEGRWQKRKSLGVNRGFSLIYNPWSVFPQTKRLLVNDQSTRAVAFRNELG
jgi:hypothetical protein